MKLRKYKWLNTVLFIWLCLLLLITFIGVEASETSKTTIGFYETTETEKELSKKEKLKNKLHLPNTGERITSNRQLTIIGIFISSTIAGMISYKKLHI